jgi:hypothetical protein
MARSIDGVFAIDRDRARGASGGRGLGERARTARVEDDDDATYANA